MKSRIYFTFFLFFIFLFSFSQSDEIVEEETDLDEDEDCLNCDWNPPTEDNKTKGITLGAPLVISKAKTSVFKTDISNRIADESVWSAGGPCTMLKPAFTFE